ncbi:MAG: hypothetical protein E7091_09840 [Bacteroidales bacterium]|nr:hypothetical protein [Bacteroidales bacterium]
MFQGTKRFLFLILSACVSLVLVEMYAQVQELRQLDGLGRASGGGTTFNERGEFGDKGNASLKDSTVISREVPRSVEMFRVSGTLGDIIPIPTDTAVHNFQNMHLADGMNGEYNFLGNMGSPRQSRIFFNRRTEQFVFVDALDFFVFRPSQFNFTNTKSPYSNVTYYRAGSKINGEERFKGYFAVNANKHAGFGFNIDYLYGRGRYDNQATSFFDGALYGYHHGDRYQMNALVCYDKLKMGENGGIVDDRYVTKPEAMAEGKKQYSPADMPVNLESAWNENVLQRAFLTQNYSFGYYKTRTDSLPDTVIVNHAYLPVTKVFHTMHLGRYGHRFIDYGNPKDYYVHNYNLPYDGIDSTGYAVVRNTLGMSLLEGVNKWVPFGASAYFTHEFRQFSLPDSISGGGEYIHRYRESSLMLGGNLRRTIGNLLHFNVLAETVLLGSDLGTFNIEGKGVLNFKLLSDTVRFNFSGYMRNSNPSFYYRHYHSQHYWWDNNLAKEFRTRLQGSIAFDRWCTCMSVGAENIRNYTYLAGTEFHQAEDGHQSTLSMAQAYQYSGNVQVLTAGLNQELKWGILHWDNEFTLQHSSRLDILPLPLLNVYSNLYLKFSYAKVLKIELGTDIRYFSRYVAPAYAPALGQFVVQKQDRPVKVGGYPFVNAYANFHLKQVRFYLMCYHVTQGVFDAADSFLVPHYPINPRMFKLGLSWNFWD